MSDMHVVENSYQFEETTMHVVRDCTVVVHVWRHLLTSQKRESFFTAEFNVWIEFNLNNEFGQRYGNDWKAIWATTCFLLWQWRNKSPHNAEFMSLERPWQVIIDYVEAYKISMMAEEQVRPGRVQQQVNVAWLLPPPRWIVEFEWCGKIK
ncbi:hypothetical protein QL285_012291 [Trifolium repens]|nr:hypothetical protein QL285_012291 [Trifolium repens]